MVSGPVLYAWDVLDSERGAAGVAHQRHIAARALLAAMDERPTGAYGILRRAHLVIGGTYQYGPILARVRRDEHTGDLLIDRPDTKESGP